MTTTDHAASTLQAARELAPEIRDRALEGERLRTMPPDLAERVEAAGLFAMCLPRALGGLELDPVTIVRVTEELSYADGSAGWTVLIGGSSAFLAWLEPGVAGELLGDRPYAASTCMIAPSGRAVVDPAGVTVDGRWAFNSGVSHARVSQVGAVVMDGDRPRMLDGHGPDWRLAYFGTEQARIVDTWDSAGLRGTGSHDLVVEGLRVPAEQFVNPLFAAPRHDGPLWRFPFFANLNVTMMGFPLGVARRALDEFVELARTKTRGPERLRVADDRHVQMQLAVAEGGVQSARAFAFDVLGELWDTACAGDPLSDDQRARLSLAAQQAMRASVAAVDAVFRLAGAGAVYADQALQRCFRDLHTADGHTFVSADVVTRYAKHRLGIAQPSFSF
ncbi:acyl-CoA dehydrogenase family protein [Pseudonocardia nigra]|uniref:acyl-CoA dehydrogenase family protein n=1 Tax=Pseudonocardia nigra TaxID=1921578 RepID=UPI001C5E89BE|nr:acyl-CoA dehydrogenase family protein [Pseudonocardia nigra]